MEWGDGACHVFVVVIRDVTADWYARSGVKEWRNGAGNIAAHVLEIDVDAVWASAGKFFSKVTRFVINAIVEAKLLFHVATFVWASGDADRT